MGVWENRFERGWFLVFMFMYGLIMLPLPWYYSETYVAPGACRCFSSAGSSTAAWSSHSPRCSPCNA